MKNNNTLSIGIFAAVFMVLFLYSSVFSFFAQAATVSAIETRPAIFLGKTWVKLNGFFDPSDSALPADYWFEWGRTDALGNFTYPRTVYTVDPRLISESIILPDSAVTYFFRAVTQNHQGKTYGQIMIFKVPNEVVSFGSFSNSNTVSESSASSSVSQPEIEILSSVVVENTVANLSFSNGAESVVAGKAGDVFEFSIRVENITDKPVYNLRVSDKLSIFLEFVDASPGYKHSGDSQNEVFWEIPKLASKGILNFTIKAKGKNFSDNIVIENNVMVVNKDFSENSGKTSILLNNSPLEIVFKAKNKKIPPGGISEYELYYRNKSDVSMENVSLQIFLPEELKFKESDRKFVEKDNVLSLKMGEIKSGQEDSIQFTTVVSEKAKNEKMLVVFATVKYQKNLSLSEETLSVATESIVDKNFVNLTAAILTEKSILPNFIALVGIFALLGLSAIIFYQYRSYRDKKEKEFSVLADTIKELEQKLKILTENSEEREEG